MNFQTQETWVWKVCQTQVALEWQGGVQVLSCLRFFNIFYEKKSWLAA
jgi:hypothetical protein